MKILFSSYNNLIIVFVSSLLQATSVTGQRLKFNVINILETE